MRDGSFDLNGQMFGAGTQVRVRAFEPGDRIVRHQDVDRPGRDGRLMGRDSVDGPEWTFDLIVKGGGGADTFDLLDQIRTAWERSHRPGELSVLRYALPGRVRRVYGRPRRFAPNMQSVKHGWHFDHYPVLATFQLTDPLIYADTASVLDLALGTASTEGVTWPVTWPVVWGSTPGQRQGEVVVGGDAPVPFEVTFHGPSTGNASGFWAAGAGWRIDLDTTLAWDQSATVDTRTSTVTRNDGRSLAGSARGRFLTARLSPGQQEISWGATDATGTARMTLTHRPGYWSL